MGCPIISDVERAATILREGGIVAFGTETVYGLGANVFDEPAIARVFEVKGRPRFDPLIVHIAELREIDRLTTELAPRARQLAERFWPGPLTLVLPKRGSVPDLVTAGLSTVAIRIPDHELARQMITLAGVPIAAPSANLFGQVSPTTAEHVRGQLGDRIDAILDGGPCRVGLESTVLAFTGERANLLRPGGVTQEEIESVIGPVSRFRAENADHPSPQPSPGLMSRHYAPRTPLRVIKAADELPAADSAGVISLGPIDRPGRFARVEVLSTQGDLREAAAGFYAALRRLDAAGLGQILAVAFPEKGLGRALNDRLRRAAR